MRRGKIIGGTGDVAPTVRLQKPEGGWSAAYQLQVAGSCSDITADPVEVNINGGRYFIRTQQGAFDRKFPSAPGKNSVVVTCRNRAGAGSASATVHAAVNPIPFKVVLTSDTDGVYTDLHLYEPDGTHVYWAQTNSPSGGLFFLNQQGESFDQPGYGPYLYVHPSPPKGVFRIDANYWPGGAVQHTLANLDLVFDEGLPSESRSRVQQPLARPGETRTLAYVVVRPNRLPPLVFIPGQDPESRMPQEVREFRKNVEPKIKSGAQDLDAMALLSPPDEAAMRAAVVQLALVQARRIAPLWEPAQRDCAGLVRFVYREALRPRTEAQRRSLGIPSGLQFPPLSDAARESVPGYPALWKLGVEHRDARQGEQQVVGSFADAESLVGNNFTPVGFDIETGQKGDLLVFRRDASLEDPYHLMVIAEGGAHGVVVYHNGAPGADGAVRVVATADLFGSSDGDWIPRKGNPSFLGVFRWVHFSRPPQASLL